MANNFGRNHQWIVVPPLHHNRDNFICAQYKCHFQLPLCGLSSHNKCFENLSSRQNFYVHLPKILELVSISSNYQILQTFYNYKLVSILYRFKTTRLICNANWATHSNWNTTWHETKYLHPKDMIIPLIPSFKLNLLWLVEGRTSTPFFMYISNLL
jgi:hypothetical protein